MLVASTRYHDQSIMEYDVWEIVPRTRGKPVVTSKWIYEIKHATNGSIERHKARFVVKGISQTNGLNYEETYAPVTRYTLGLLFHLLQ